MCSATRRTTWNRCGTTEGSRSSPEPGEGRANIEEALQDYGQLDILINNQGRDSDVDVLTERLAQIVDAGRPAAVNYQHERGKLTARERIAALVDPGSLREFGALVRPDSGAELDYAADGVVTGTADIDGRSVVVASYDFTVAGGSNGALGNAKVRRCIELALAHGHPLVLLLEGGGHRIQEGLDSRDFAPGVTLPQELSRLSGWVPTVAAVLGPGFAGPTLLATMCDFAVMVRGQSTMGVAPPIMVKAAVGEDVTAEELGGAAAQADRNGIVELAVADEPAAFAALRRYLSYLPANAVQAPPVTAARPPEPAHAAGLDTVVPQQARRGYDMSKALLGIVDEDSFFELKPTYAKNLIVGFGRIEGRPVGFVANQPAHRAGVLDSPACEKAARFVSLCDAFGLALVFVVDMPGFLVGSDAEGSQLARRGARLLFELGHATVPRYTVIARKAYGGGYIAMSGGRSFSPELTLAWPTAEMAAMAVAGAIDIAYRKQIAASTDPTAERAALIVQHGENLGAVRAAEGFGVDAVIAPSQTRDALARSLSSAHVHRLAVSQPPRRHPIPPI